MSYRKFGCWLLAAASLIAVMGATGGEPEEASAVATLGNQPFLRPDRFHALVSDSLRSTVMLAAMVALFFTYSRVWQNMRRRD